MKRVVIYDRSALKMEDMNIHLSECQRRICLHSDWDIVGVFVDNGCASNKKIQFIEVCEMAKKQDFDLLFIRDVSRISRNTLEVLDIVTKFTDLGIEIYLDNYNTVIKNINQLMDVIVKGETEKIKRRIKNNRI